MPKYEITFWREVITNDEVTRVIEAPDYDSAVEHAQKMASEFNDNCPDDAIENECAMECREWQVDYEADQKIITGNRPADEVVGGDDVD